MVQHRTAVSSRVIKGPSTTSAPGVDRAAVSQAVADIVGAVRSRGDDAVREYSERFDHWSPAAFRLTPDEIAAAIARVPGQVLDDIRFVQSQVRTMAERQLASLTEFEIETLPGVHLGQKNIPISSSAAYVPGGRYPMLASAHMTIVTAKVAGVARVSAATPPMAGAIPDTTVAGMALAGADEIYILGGVQAIAALGVGTDSIPKVDLIAGPGNAYVAEAKRQLYGEVGIDLLAGPTEILIVADDAADPFLTAVDLLSQAEHGPDSPAALVTTSEPLGRAVLAHIERLLPLLPTRDNAEAAWRDHGEVHVVETLSDAYALADDFAFEHVQIFTREPREALSAMRHYGALFLGEGTCVPYGDKTIGTNHVLPTRGNARHSGGLWVGKFLRTVTYQEVTDREASSKLAEVTGRAARVEHFEGHARSADARLAKYRGEAFDWVEAAGQHWQ